MAKKKAANSKHENRVEIPVTIRINTLPVAQPRQRFSSFGGFARAYTPTSVGKGKNRKPHPIVEFRRAVAEACKEFSGPIFTSPLRVNVRFVFPRPKNKVWKNKPMLPYYHDAKPDIDNCCKALWDCLNGVVWEDDSQIAVCTAVKVVAGEENIPYVAISIRPLK